MQETPSPNKTYSFQLQRFTLFMMLNDNGDIQMEFFYKQTEKLYDLFINQQFINENPFLAVIYKSPKTLFNDILVNVNKISVNDEGLITYTILVNSKPMSLGFHSKQKKFTKQQKILKLISQLKKDSEQNIDCLNKDQEALKQENLQLRQKLRRKLQLNKYHESNLMVLLELNKIQNSHRDLINMLEKQKNSSIEHSKQIKTLKAQLQEDSNWKIIQLRKETQTKAVRMKLQIEDKQTQLIAQNKYDQNNNQLLQTINKKDKQQIININPQKQANQAIRTQINTQNIKQFEMIENSGILKLKYLCGNVSHGFLRPFALEINKITHLQVRQAKTRGTFIMYGVSTDKTIGMQRPHKHLECKSYYARDGRVVQNGKYRQGGAVINDGTVVTIVADLINWKISWEVNGNKLADAEISVVMRVNKLYLIITMYRQNDEVQILNY